MPAASLATASPGAAAGLRRFGALLSPDTSLPRPQPLPGQLLQYSRLLLVTDDVNAAQQALAKPPAPAARGYDILSIQPQSERVWAAACSSLDVDVISLDLGRRLPFKLRPAQLKAALARGVAFEIRYSPALLEGDSSARQAAFAAGSTIARATGESFAGAATSGCLLLLLCTCNMAVFQEF